MAVNRGRRLPALPELSIHDVCNWEVPGNDPNPYCISCRLTRALPDLSVAGNKMAWTKFEAAKRRLNYGLLGFGLPVTSKTDDPERGVGYEFLADLPNQPVLTGHEFGVITINIAEADDAEREKRRLQLHEPYRTILGHFRHEIGHYYWDRFFVGQESLSAFRNAFGDESQDYAETLKHHCENGTNGMAGQFYLDLCYCPPLGGLGRDLGALSSNDRHLGNGGGGGSLVATAT